MPDKSGAEYACVDSAFRGAEKLYDIFTHYKFGIAIWYVLGDEYEKMKSATILKLETALVKDEIRIVRERVSRAMGTCSKFPLAIAKGTELLAALKKADGIIKTIGEKL
jgi:hypothetical protein